MIENWSEAQHRRLVRQRVGVIAGIAIVIVLGTVVGSIRGTDTAPVESAAPGLRAEEASVETSPFVLARPKSYGATTLPDAMIDSTTTSTTTTTTTTTTPPTTTTLPIPERQKDPICDAFVVLITYKRSGLGSPEDPDAFATKAIGNLSVWIEQLRTIDARTYAGAIGKLEQVVAELRNRPSAGELLVIMSDLSAPDTRTKPLVDYAMKACPAVLAAR